MQEGISHGQDSQWDELPFIPTPTYQPPNITSSTFPGSSNLNFDDPTTGVFPVGSPQWYAQMGTTTSNLEAMVEEASGYDITQDWLDKYGSMLPMFDPTAETFAEARYDLAGEKYDIAEGTYGIAGEAFGLAKEGYQGELGDIFGQAGTGTMDLLSSWSKGGDVMTGRKRRQKKSIGATTERATRGAKRKLGGAELQYDIAGQAYEGAGLTYAGAGITKASEKYDIRTAFADKFSAAISDLAADEAFVDLDLLDNISTTTTDVPTTTVPTTPGTFSNPTGETDMVFDYNTNTWVYPGDTSNTPLPLGPG